MSMSEEEARREIARLVELHGPGILMDAAGKVPKGRKRGPKPGQRRNIPPQEHLDEMADLIVAGAVKGRTDGASAAARVIATKYLGMPPRAPVAEREDWRGKIEPLVRNFRDRKDELLARARERAKPKIVQVPRSPLWGGFNITDLAVDPLDDPRIGTAWERLEAYANRRPDPGSALDRLNVAAGAYDVRVGETATERALREMRERHELYDWKPPHLRAIEEALQRNDYRYALERAESSAERMMREQLERDQAIADALDPFRRFRR